MTQSGQNIKDMSGQIVNGLLILSRRGSNTQRLATWNCKCPCGKEFVAVGADIRKGKIKTCGCRKSIKNPRNWQGYKDISKTHWMTIVQNAEQRNLEFSITIEYAWQVFELQSGKCALSGLSLTLGNKDRTASLDRKDSSKGYIKSNVQWVHKDVNKMKNSFNDERFVEICQAVASYQMTT